MFKQHLPNTEHCTLYLLWNLSVTKFDLCVADNSIIIRQQCLWFTFDLWWKTLPKIDWYSVAIGAVHIFISYLRFNVHRLLDSIKFGKWFETPMHAQQSKMWSNLSLTKTACATVTIIIQWWHFVDVKHHVSFKWILSHSKQRILNNNNFKNIISDK